MFDVLIVVACLYFAYDLLRMTFKVPFAEWGWAQGAGLVVGVLLLVMAGIKGWASYKKYKAKKEEEAQESAGEEEAGGDAAEREPAKLDAQDSSDDDDLAYLDEMDAEEEARKRDGAGDPEPPSDKGEE